MSLQGGERCSYIVLARKYRPTVFSELVGQEVLVKILSYAIANQRVAHAYLLTGIRGVGKTTTARIIAKTVNCSDKIINNEDVVPCDACCNCLAFQNNRHPDIIEVDAASNTGVDDVRTIIETSEYRPLQGVFKIFIIDEVHMLSKNAFNALLKTLEEPPLHVIFILATTEVNKVPLTIASRCQRFDLRRLDIKKLLLLLESICNKEGISCVPEALELIAYKSDGSVRDALSLLDQAIILAACTKQRLVTLGIVDDMLGNASTKEVVALFSTIINGQTNDAIKMLAKLYEINVDLIFFTQGIIDFIGYLSKSKLIDNYSTPSYANYCQEITSILKFVSLPHLTILWQIFNKGMEELKNSCNTLLTMEMLIIKAIYANSLLCPKKALQDNVENKDVKRTIETIADAPENSPSDSAKIGKDTKYTEVEPNAYNLANNTKTEDVDTISLLTYLYQNYEFDLYYYLMNQVEIIDIKGNKIFLSTVVADQNLHSRLVEVLLKWTKQKWNIVLTSVDKVTSFKQSLKGELTKSYLLKKVTDTFPQTKVVDILFNSNVKV